MRRALGAWPSAIDCWKEARARSVEELLGRMRAVAQREARIGGRAYVGSTSDPAWRWQGGYYEAADPRGPPGASVRRYMAGHRHQWRRMEVVGSWRDAECGQMEEAALRELNRVCPGRLTNIATDARGLEIRAFKYSFVYICTSRIS